jgi:hypothetical protein
LNTREAFRRLRAFHGGRPIPSGETKRTFVAEDKDSLIVSFVRMGGESRPWGIAFGVPGSTPKLLAVSEARNRGLVAEMAAEFAPVLLRHFRCPDYCTPAPSARDDLASLKQVWLPNNTHLDMLHHLAYAYTWTKFGGEKRALLNALGRACGWLFREAQRPGQMAVMVASEVLREAYTFPAEDIRQSHLAYLMAWLETKGNFEKRLAVATKAERQSVATSLDPDLERSVLEPLVEQWGEAEKHGPAARKTKLLREIRNVLQGELERRWKLTERAIETIRTDRRLTNVGVKELVTQTLDEQWYQYTRLELNKNDTEDGPAFTPSVETDRHPAAAASRYLIHQASSDLLAGLLVHDDAELLAEAIAEGDAFRGEIVSVADQGSEKETRPIWKILDQADRQLRLQVGSWVSVVGFKERGGCIRSFDDQKNGNTIIEVEITSRKTNRKPGPGVHSLAPNNPRWKGRTVAFVSAPADTIPRMKSRRVWRSDGPGAWLTHRKPGGPVGSLAEDDRDDVSIVHEALQPE